MTRPFRVAIVGGGSIGATLAYTLVLTCPLTEVILANRDTRKAWGKSFDMQPMRAVACTEGIRESAIGECRDCDMVILTVGTLPKANGTRADVLAANIDIYAEHVPALATHNPNALFMSITNPVDGMAYALQRIGKLPAHRVMGSGTELDAMRLSHFIAEQFHLDPKHLDIKVIGEHGDSMVPLWSSATYECKPLEQATGVIDAQAREALLHKTRRAGWDIRLAGEHSCYAIAYAASRIVRTVLGFSFGTRLVSTSLGENENTSPLFLSLPTPFDSTGMRPHEFPVMLRDEELALEHSMEILAAQQAQVDELLGE